MKIHLYINQSEKNEVNKLLASEIELDGSALRDEANNIETPIIRIVSSSTNIFKYNYCYIPEFFRYYWFSSPPTILRNGIYEINLESDPLMSFKDEFLQNSGYVETSKNYGNFYLDDQNMPIQQNTKISTVKQFSSPFSENNTSVVMNVLGLSSSYEFTTE